MNKLTEVQKIAKSAGFSGIVTEENVKEIVVSLAKNHGQKLSDYLDNKYNQAVKNYTSRGDIGDKIYSDISDMCDSILALLDIQFDYGVGLYPSFELTRNGKHFTEHSVSGAIKQYNNFWNHW